MKEHKFERTDLDGLDRRPAVIALDKPIVVEADETVAARLEQFGINAPRASVLPRNFAVANSPEDFVYEQMTSTIRILGRQVGLEITVAGPSGHHTIHERDHEIIIPVMQFAHAFLIEGGATITVSFFEHLARHLESRCGRREAREYEAAFELVVTRGRMAKRLTYRGPVQGLPSIVEAARTAFGANSDDC